MLLLVVVVVVVVGRVSSAAKVEVVGRWETQGLAWVDALDWQKRALQAERRVGQVTDCPFLMAQTDSIAGGRWQPPH